MKVHRPERVAPNMAHLELEEMRVDSRIVRFTLSPFSDGVVILK